MNDAKIKAVRIIERLKWESYAGNGLFVIEAVEALSRAGLLVTPLHERALEACRELARHNTDSCCIETARALNVGREALALERPKERWTVERQSAITWSVYENGVWRATIGTEADARAYADQKNREDAAKNPQQATR